MSSSQPGTAFQHTRSQRILPHVATISSAGAVIILAFLVPYALLQSCSLAAVSVFLVLFGVSVILAFTGIVSGAMSYRKTRNRLALLSLPFGLIYAAGLLLLLNLL